jgi:hypothetical protein
MTIAPRLPDDLGECQRLPGDVLRRNDELRQQAEAAQQQAATAEQQAATAEQQVAEAERRVDELERVLDQTAAEYDRLKAEHTELAETLALLRRYIFGRRSERFIDDPGQGHLFDIPEILDEPEPATSASDDEVAAQRPATARSPRRTRLDHLPHIRIPHDLPELQRTLVLRSPVLWTDDTWVTVLGGKQLGSFRGRFWAYIGDAQHPYSVYDFTVNRGRDGPASFLKDYRGECCPSRPWGKR